VPPSFYLEGIMADLTGVLRQHISMVETSQMYTGVVSLATSLAIPCRGVLCVTGGSGVITMADGSSVTLTSITAGTVLPLAAVLSSTTNFVGLL